VLLFLSFILVLLVCSTIVFLLHILHIVKILLRTTISIRAPIVTTNVACKRVGIGNIRMKMFDGHVRILKNVRHAPGRRKIFCRWEPWKLRDVSSRPERALKITKSSITVLKIERTVNLYKVIESVVIGDTS